MKKRQSDGSEASAPSILEDSGKANGTFTTGFNLSPLYGNSKGRVTKTLVVHPSDPNTSRLKGIYAGIPGLTVKTGEVSNRKMIELIETHDRILLIGNGDPWGLFGNGRFSHSFWAIDDAHAELLRKKADTGSMLVWPGANWFVRRHGIDMFAFGDLPQFDTEWCESHEERVVDVVESLRMLLMDGNVKTRSERLEYALWKVNRRLSAHSQKEYRHCIERPERPIGIRA